MKKVLICGFHVPLWIPADSKLLLVGSFLRKFRQKLCQVEVVEV